MSEDCEIAIVGIGCRFPGANNVEEYWRVLSKGENHVVDIPKSRWNVDAFFDADPNMPGKSYARKAGLVQGIDEWDHRLFGFSDVEAEFTDPQQRMVLDCVHMALEDGGITRRDIEGSDTSVYVGVMTTDYKEQVMDYDNVVSPYTVTGSHPSIISARVSYVYNLCGPAMTIDTACSSSLVAIDLGSQALKSKSCSMAICGGVNLLLDPQTFIALSKARMLSPMGQCKTFTKFADGYVRGEGCGVVILKRLPDVGTGTSIGDPTETSALGTFFKSETKDIYIGSVKTNIGHLEAAAGVAAVIKVLLMMKHGQIVPSLWYSKENENPSLNLKQYGFVVPTACTTWKTTIHQRRIACVNSFGFGGTNAHAIVEQYFNNRQVVVTPGIFTPIVVLSAFENKSLKYCVKHLCDCLRSTECNILTLSYTSTCKRDHWPKRRSFVCQTQEDLLIQCKNFISQKKVQNDFPQEKNIVFVFCGVGTTWPGMASWLIKIDCFKTKLKEIDSHLKPLAGWKVADKLQENSSGVTTDSILGHIAIFAYQVALVEVWKHFGIQPNALVGQSVGEVAAAYVAGSIDLQTAVLVIFHRSKILASVEAGTMAVVKNVAVDKIEQYCKATNSLCIAVYSSSSACTVSGKEHELRQLEKHFSVRTEGQSQVIFLGVKCAYHSQFVDKAAEELSCKISNIKAQTASIPLFSTVTGEMITNDVFGRASYWAKNVRSPVLFAQAIQKSFDDLKHNIYLEIGPSPVLAAHLQNILSNHENLSVVASVKGRSEKNSLAKAICSLYEYGLDLKWTNIVPSQNTTTDFPVYHGRKIKRLYQSPSVLESIQGFRTNRTFVHPYIEMIQNTDTETCMKATIDRNSTPFVYQHVIGENNILPGAYYSEIGYALGIKYLCEPKEYMIVSLEFLRVVRVDQSNALTLLVDKQNKGKDVLFHVQLDQIVTCKGRVRAANIKQRSLQSTWVNMKGMRTKIQVASSVTMNKSELYETFHSLGFIYGDSFQMISRFYNNKTESFSDIDVPTKILDESQEMTIHPCILDVLLQTTILTADNDFITRAKKENRRFLPVAIEEIQCFRKPENKMMAHTKLVNFSTFDSVFQLHYNMLLTDLQGEKIAEVRNFMTYSKRLGIQAPSDLNYELVWFPVELKSDDSCPRLFVLAKTVEIDHLFKSYPSVSIFQTSRSTYPSSATFVRNAFEHLNKNIGLENIDAIGIVMKCRSVDNHALTTEGVSLLYDESIENCEFLAEVFTYMRNNGMEKPSYFITENTQTLGNDQHYINCIGSEVWGFVRSASIELITDMTIVDARPSVAACIKTLLNYISWSCKNSNDTHMEIVIEGNKIWHSEFAKTYRYVCTPTKRLMGQTKQVINHPQHILSKSHIAPDHVHLSPVLDIQNKESSSSILKMYVTCIAIPPNSVYPMTNLGEFVSQELWEGVNDLAYAMRAVEFRGYITRAKNNNLAVLNCQTNMITEETRYEGQWEVVALYPTIACTEILVPKKLLVNLREIPFYQPGLLTYSMLCWKMKDHIPNKSSVFIHCSENKGIAYRLLIKMLESKKDIKIKSTYDVADINEDILLILDNADQYVNMIQSFRHIVCLEGKLSCEAIAALNRSKDRKLSILNTRDILEEHALKKAFGEMIKWLKRCEHNFIDGNKAQNVLALTENSNDLPWPAVNVMNNSLQSLLPIRKNLQCMFSKSAVYVVTGGLSGLGWALTKLMAEMGAGIIATLTRSNPTNEVKEEIRILEIKTSCKIICLKGNVADITSVQEAFISLSSVTNYAPICGIFHCAGVSKGKMIINMNRQDLNIVMKPKILGTMNLHKVTSEMRLPLEYFVIASSISSLIGSPGQSNYGAANSFIDAFASWRRYNGLPCQSINWGALEIGMAANPEFSDLFVKRGFNLMSVKETRNCFQACLLKNSSGVFFADINWDVFANFFLSKSMKRILLQFVGVIKQSSLSTLKAELQGEKNKFNVSAMKLKSPEERMVSLLSLVKTISSTAVGSDIKDNQIGLTLAELPFDSMSTVTLTEILYQQTGYRIPSEFMMNTSHTLMNVVEHVYRNIFFENDVRETKGNGVEKKQSDV